LKTRLRLLVCALVMAAPLGIAMPAAHADDCLSAEVQVWTQGDPNPYYPIGQKYCVVPLPYPFQEAGDLHVYDHEGWIPPGYPYGIDVYIWYVLV
jgi:hypothetical protein